MASITIIRKDLELSRKNDLYVLLGCVTVQKVFKIMNPIQNTIILVLKVLPNEFFFSFGETFMTKIIGFCTEFMILNTVNS